MLGPQIESPHGVTEAPVAAPIIAAANFNAGQLGVLDFANSTQYATNNEPGRNGSGFSVARAATDAGPGQVFGVWLDSVAAGKTAPMKFAGVCLALVKSTGLSIVAGTRLAPSGTGSVLTDDTDNGARYIAIALETVDTPGSNSVLCHVALDGIHGLGIAHEET